MAIRNSRQGKTPEGSVKAAIRDFLSLYGIFHYVQVQGFGSVRGVADLIGMHNGRFMAIEVKAPGRKVKPGSAQDRFLKNVDDHGGIAIVADGVEALVRGFKRYGIEFNVLF